MEVGHMVNRNTEIRIDNDFLAEVKVDDNGETVVGRTYKGKGFRGMPLMAFFSRAERIGTEIKIAAAIEHGTA